MAPDSSRTAARVFDDLHRDAGEPWDADASWYEARKRSLLLAGLPRPRFRLGLEVGCSTGVLTAGLAERCDRLVASDVSAEALRTAGDRLRGLAGVDLVQGLVPDDWPLAPGERPDLVVLSEIGYFLEAAGLDRLAAQVRDTLADDGVVVLCHWRHEVDGWPLDGPDVHGRLRESGLPPVAASYVDRDVELLVLCDPALLPRAAAAGPDEAAVAP